MLHYTQISSLCPSPINQKRGEEKKCTDFWRGWLPVTAAGFYPDGEEKEKKTDGLAIVYAV